MRRPITILLAAGVIASATPPVASQEVMRIAAIVNDDVVSVYDLNARMQMIVVTLGLKITPQIHRRLKPQIMRGLIDERLRMQEAKRRNISVTKGNMKKAVASVSAQNNIPAARFEEFLRSQNIPVDTVLNQIRSEIAWNKLVSRRLRPRIIIGDDEIDEVMARIKSRQGQTEYRISEIFLAIDSPEQERAARLSAQRLIKQIRQGAKFSAVARQFSQSASASTGGDLGWIHEGALDQDIQRVIMALEQGGIAGPIATVSGFKIVRLDRKRRVATANPDDAVLRLHQLILSLPPNASKADIDTQTGLATIMAETITGCGDMARAAKEVKSPGKADLGKLRQRDLAPTIRKAISALPVGRASGPVHTPDGIHLFMVCQRQEVKSALPDRAQIEQQLVRGRLGMMARRYLRDLRIAAVIDLRV